MGCMLLLLPEQEKKNTGKKFACAALQLGPKIKFW